MKKELLESLEKNEIFCSRCGLLIPFVYKKGGEVTCPSFTIIEDEPVCYFCYHPVEFENAIKKRDEARMKK